MDKKYLTKFNAIFLVIFLTVILLISGCSCNPFDNGSKAFLKKQMDKLQPEVTGYKIVRTTDMDNNIAYFKGTVTINETDINIQRKEGSIYSYYIISYNDKEIVINNEYMREKSEAYVYIHDIWNRWKNKSQPTIYDSEIYSVCEFDNRLFIVTNGLFARVTANIRVNGMIPVTLYEFNIETEEVLYAGYLNYCTDSQVMIVIEKTEEK